MVFMYDQTYDQTYRISNNQDIVTLHEKKKKLDGWFNEYFDKKITFNELNERVIQCQKMTNFTKV